jgi:transcriptional regulator with XRE-family HTH domain
METRSRGIKLGAVVRKAREANGLSTRQLGAAIGTTHSYIHKLEAGWFQTISPENVQALARALDLDRQDLFALAGYRVPEGLPNLGPYLRTKYGEALPDEAIAEITSFFDYTRDKYRTDMIDDESEVSS